MKKGQKPSWAKASLSKKLKTAANKFCLKCYSKPFYRQSITQFERSTQVKTIHTEIF